MNIIKNENLTWVNIKKPQSKDIDWLKENFKLHPLVLKEILPPLDYPRIEKFGDYLFIVLFYPFFDRETFQTIPFELDIIVSKKYIITSYYKDIVPLKAIFDRCNLYEEEKEKHFNNGSGELLYQIIKELLDACFPKLGHIKQNIDNLEKIIYQKKYQEAVNRASLIERDIIGFQRIIESQKLVLKDLSKESEKFFSKKFIPYFNALVNLYDKIESILINNHKTIDALTSTNQSLLTNRTNEIIKLLTIFSVIVFPLTLLAAIFGMNTTYLPLVGNPGDFWIIAGIMAIGTIGMLTLFKIKKWL